jgi:hypothetical protein
MIKMLLSIAFALFIYGRSLAQTCGTDGILLENQAQVDAFATTYPGCTQVGQLEITGPGIVNLNGLGGIASIQGDLNLHDCPNLTTMGGFNLSGVGALSLTNNALLTDFAGFEAVTSLGLSVINCPAITSFSGLGNVASLPNLHLEGTGITNFTALTSLTQPGYIKFVGPNPNLKNFVGFEAATILAGGITIGEGMVMTDFTGLDNVTGMYYLDIWGKLDSFKGLGALKATLGWMDIYETADIPNFKGLNSLVFVDRLSCASTTLTSLEGLESLDSTLFGVAFVNSKIQNLAGLTGMSKVSLALLNNALLTDVSAIENTPITGLRIEGSPLLSDCAAKSICIYLTNPTNPVTLAGNAVGCSTRDQIVNSIECQTILPVELLSFTGMQTPEGNKLMWQTTWETGNKGFEIERSTDMRNFEKIGFVEGYGESNTQKKYSFTDAGISKVSYYRLKQIDHDQTYYYSKTIAIHNSPRATRVYPNPAKGRLNIDAADRDQGFTIKNSQGVTVMEGSVLPQDAINTSSLRSGIYFLSVGKEAFKMVVQQ